MTVLCFDIDGTVCTRTRSQYHLAKPFENARATINRLYEEGFTIVFFTARFMGRYNGEVEKAYKEGYEFTKRQLDGWGFKYHHLIMGKPSFHVQIDDKSLFHNDDWDLIYREIKEKAREDMY
jgi:hypothetical protein